MAEEIVAFSIATEKGRIGRDDNDPFWHHKFS